MTEDKLAKITAVTFLTLAGVAVGMGIVALHAISLVWLWHWFITPLGAPTIGVFHALGLTAMLGLVKTMPIKNKESLEEKTYKLAYLTALPLSALLMGYVLQLFM